MTNGDKIRQMTDEEIADMLNVYEITEICRYCANCESTCIGGSCYYGILEWLKQDIEEVL